MTKTLQPQTGRKSLLNKQEIMQQEHKPPGSTNYTLKSVHSDHERAVSSVKFSRDGKLLASACECCALLSSSGVYQ
jgi:WD40 repeat protein